MSKRSLMKAYEYRSAFQGQVMAVYSDVGGNLALAEQPVYGAGRIGIAYNGNNNSKTYVYELTDHLGNVRVVFTKSGGNVQLEGYTDYYPFGMPMPNRGLVNAYGYRYAFQGQEKDSETGKEAFELRLWDGRIGRWLTTDPYGQYNSPYVGMGNDPINGIDPDGGWKTKFGAWLYKTFNGGGEIVGEKGNWSVAQQGADGWDTFITNNPNGFNNSASEIIWNSNAVRGFTGDAVSIGGGAAANIFFGADVNAEFTWVIRGNDASAIPNFTLGPAATVGDGGEITVSAFLSKKFYNGSVGEIKALDLGGYSAFVEGGLTPGIGGFAGVDVSLNTEYRPTWVSVYAGVSGGAEASPLTAVNIKGGVRHNTVLIHSNGNLYINNPVEPSKNLTVTPSFDISYE